MGDHGTIHFDPGVFQLHMKIQPGLVVDGVVSGNDFEAVCCFQVTVACPAERLVYLRQIIGHFQFLVFKGDSTIPQVGLFGRGVSVFEVLKKSFTDRRALRHQVQVFVDIARGCGVGKFIEFIDPVEAAL
ncbi:hypothetical protein D3C85_1418940 [compost metagenome]